MHSSVAPGTLNLVSWRVCLHLTARANTPPASLRLITSVLFHFSVYNRFDIQKIGSGSPNATRSRMGFGVVRRARLNDQHVFSYPKRENR